MARQYVNLEPSRPDHHGSRVFIEVEAARLGGAVGTTEWWVEPAPDKDPPASGVGAGNTFPKYLSAQQRCRISRPYDSSRDGKFRNALVLPHVGGDKYKVNCSKKGDRSGAKASEEYETWRKIFYTVHWMNAACKAKFDAVKDRFEAAFALAFVEMHKKADSQTKADETRTCAEKPELPHLYDAVPALSDKPFHLRIVVLNDIYDAAAKPYPWASTRSKVLTKSIAPEELSDHTATHWLKSARAMVLPSGGWTDIDTYVTKTGPSEFKVDLTAHPSLSTEIDNGKSLKVEVWVRQRDHYLGHSLGNFVCVRINETGTDAEIERTILQTFTHEVGHGLQQVVKQERMFKPDGSPDGNETNPWWHTDDHGGQGPHCFTNGHEVPARPPTSTTSHKTYEHETGKGKLCTMFFRDDPEVDPDGKFCDGCLARLKRAKLNAVEMKMQGWDRF